MPSELGLDEAERIIAVDQPLGKAGLDTAAGGYLGKQVSKPSTHVSEVVGLLAAVVILLFTFGTFVAMGMPILTAVLGLAIGMGIITLLSHTLEVPSSAPALATMIGLGVGIDYALFIVTRHRSQLAGGMEPRESVARAVTTSGGAVVFAGGTVMIAMISLVAARIPLVTTLGFTASVVVLVALLAAITLLPAVLGLLGTGINRLRLPGMRIHHDERPHGWARWAAFVGSHPLPALLVGAAILVVLALPVRALHLGQVDNGSMPTDTQTRQSYDLMTDGFGVGSNGPMLVAVSLSKPAQNDQKQLEEVQKQQQQQEQQTIQQETAKQQQQADQQIQQQAQQQQTQANQEIQQQAQQQQQQAETTISEQAQQLEEGAGPAAQAAIEQGAEQEKDQADQQIQQQAQQTQNQKDQEIRQQAQQTQSQENKKIAQQVQQQVEQQAKTSSQGQQVEQQEEFLKSKASDPRLVSLRKDIEKTSGVDSVTLPLVNDNGDAAVLTVTPTTAPSAIATEDLVDKLRDDVIPAATKGKNMSADVGGSTASYIDLAVEITDQLPRVIGIVLVLSYLVLLLAFRSLLVSLKAVLMNALSILSAFGVVTYAFNHDWTARLIGLEGAVPIISFVPLMMFAVLFGLSMDYEVFLMTHVREEWMETGDPHEAVVHGLATTGRVITSAAMIMVSVFLAFVINGDPTIKQFGLGMAAAVAVDATVVRCLLVPAIMSLLGYAGWWMPKWLDWALPNFSIEGEGFFDDMEAATVASKNAEPAPEPTEETQGLQATRLQDDATGPETSTDKSPDS